MLDAFLAANAIEHRCAWITTDRDFSGFPSLTWILPVDEADGVRGSQFGMRSAVRGASRFASSLTVRRSAFTVRRSPLRVPGSEFGVRVRA